MADLGQIVNDQSTAEVSQPLNVLRSTSAMLQPPVPIQKANDGLDSLNTVVSLTYPTDIPKYYMTFGVSDYTRESIMTVGKLTPEATVILPLPEQLVDTNHVEYGEAALGAFGAFVNAVENTSGARMKSAISAAKTLTNATDLKDAGSKAVDIVSKSTGVSVTDLLSGGLAAMGNEASNISAIRNIEGVLGFSPNEFFTILMKGPVYKRHHFTWRFSPRNEKESKTLRLIIQNFNNWRAPGLAAGGLLFSFPKIFQLAFEPNSSYLYKFKPCVLEDFVIDYAGSGMPAFFRQDSSGSNAPESIAFSMQFIELEYWITGDYKNVSNDGLVPNNTGSDIDGPNRGGASNTTSNVVTGSTTTSNTTVPGARGSGRIRPGGLGMY